MTHLLSRNPVDGGANTALAVLRAWNRPHLSTVLEDLLTRRYEEASGLGAIRMALSTWFTKKVDRQPRNYQVTQATLALFQRVRCDSLDQEFKQRIRFLLETTGSKTRSEKRSPFSDELLRFSVLKKSVTPIWISSLRGRWKSFAKTSSGFSNCELSRPVGSGGGMLGQS